MASRFSNLEFKKNKIYDIYKIGEGDSFSYTGVAKKMIASHSFINIICPLSFKQSSRCESEEDDVEY